MPLSRPPLRPLSRDFVNSALAAGVARWLLLACVCWRGCCWLLLACFCWLLVAGGGCNATSWRAAGSVLVAARGLSRKIL